MQPHQTICVGRIAWESAIVGVLLCTICVRERKEKQGGNWGVKMNGKLQQGCENELLLQKEYIQYY